MSPIRIALAGAALALSAPALATDITDPFVGERPMTLELHAGFTPFSRGLAAGGRLGIPLVDNGFVGPINNSVYLNFGADFYLVSRVFGLDSGGIGIGVPVAVQWNFYFNDEWSAFAEVGLNIYVDQYFFDGNGILFNPGWVVSAVGGRYQFNDSMSLIGRVGSPYASIGIELTL